MPPKVEFVLWLGPPMAGLVAMAACAWIGLDKYWRRHLRGISLPGIYKKVQMLFWLSMSTVLAFCTLVIVMFAVIWFGALAHSFTG